VHVPFSHSYRSGRKVLDAPPELCHAPSYRWTTTGFFSSSATSSSAPLEGPRQISPRDACGPSATGGGGRGHPTVTQDHQVELPMQCRCAEVEVIDFRSWYATPEPSSLAAVRKLWRSWLAVWDAAGGAHGTEHPGGWGRPSRPRGPRRRRAAPARGPGSPFRRVRVGVDVNGRRAQHPQLAHLAAPAPASGRNATVSTTTG
jgi:hypothetical protein